MMKRMSNADFHKFLTEFSNAVAQGKYKKMPYDKYRTFRNWHNTSVDIVLDSYTNLNGNIATRIRISPEGPTGYEFYIDDGSFGNFCYDYLKKEEPKVHPDNENKKIQYDIFGNELEYFGYVDKCKKIDNAAKEAWLDYCTEQALKENVCSESSVSSVISNIAADKCSSINYTYPISETQSTTAGISTTATIHTEIKTKVDIVQEEVESLERDIQDIINTLSTKADNATVKDEVYELRRAVDDLHEQLIRMREHSANNIDALESRMTDEEYFTRAELEQMIYELEDRVYTLENSPHIVPADKVAVRGTSSNCYPAKNFKIDVAAWDTPCSDNGKEKENMDTNKMFNFDFGPVDAHIRMSPYGLAIRNAEGKYVSFDKETSSMMDVEIFNFDAQNFLFKMPVPVNQIAPGDIVVHMRKPMFVCSVNANTVFAVDIYNAEAKNIMPVKSPFGFNFVTKVVSLVDMTTANAENPFGNALPFLMMGEGKSFKDIMPFIMATNPAMMQNPMMMYALMGDGGFDKDMLLPMMFAMNPNFMNPVAPVAPTMVAPATEHVCHCHADQAPCGDNTDAVNE